MAKDTRWDRDLSVAADADGLIGHAGAVLLRKLSDQCGLTPGARRGAGPEGEVPADPPGDGVGLDDGGDRAGAASMSDVAVLAHQEPVLGAAPSDTTVRRTLELADACCQPPRGRSPWTRTDSRRKTSTLPRSPTCSAGPGAGPPGCDGSGAAPGRRAVRPET
jgi:hypothetical protein